VVDTGSSAVAMRSMDGSPASWFSRTPRRPEALEAMLALGRMGCLALLSGDRREVVARVAASIGCTDFAGDLSPADKPLRVRALRTRAGG